MKTCDAAASDALAVVTFTDVQVGDTRQERLDGHARAARFSHQVGEFVARRKGCDGRLQVAILFGAAEQRAQPRHDVMNVEASKGRKDTAARLTELEHSDRPARACAADHLREPEAPIGHVSYPEGDQTRGEPIVLEGHRLSVSLKQGDVRRVDSPGSWRAQPPACRCSDRSP